VTLRSDAALYCNEEGKLQGLPPNRQATAFVERFRPGFAHFDTLVGDCVVVGVGADGESVDVPGDVVDVAEQVVQAGRFPAAPAADQ
jgi:hypothetical protein